MILLAVVGCSVGDAQHRALTDWMNRNGKVKVLSTTAMIDDLVRQVGGEYVDALVLIKGELDPHSYQLVKGDDEKLAFADVIFYSGLGLEHGPSLQSYLFEHEKSVPLGNKIMGNDPSLLLYYKGQPDPHIWMDISIWERAVVHIVNVLSAKDPVHSEEYAKNGAALKKTMMQAHQEIRRMIQEIPANKRYLVTSHDAFNYFTRAYLAADGEGARVWSERFAAPEGLAPESQISSTDIQSTIDHLSRYSVRVIFPESNVNRDSIRKIVEAARSKGIEVEIADVSLYADAMGKPGSDGDTYLKMLQHNARAMAANLIKNGG